MEGDQEATKSCPLRSRFCSGEGVLSVAAAVHDKRMAAGQLVPIVRPVYLREQGYGLRLGPDYLRGPVRYNYWLEQDGVVLNCSRTGSRGMLSYLFPPNSCPGRRRRREYLHRLLAFNLSRINPGPQPRPFSRYMEVHHGIRSQPVNIQRPWLNSRWQNLFLMTRTAHRRWHEQHPWVDR